MSAIKNIAVVGVVAGTTALATYVFTQDKFKTVIATSITSIGTILTQILRKG